MAHKTEAQITKQTVAHLKSLEAAGLWFWKVSDRFTVGIPDILGCYRGLLFAIELKRPGQRPTKLQRYVLAKIAAAGGATLATDSIDDVYAFTAGLVNTSRLLARPVSDTRP